MLRRVQRWVRSPAVAAARNADLRRSSEQTMPAKSAEQQAAYDAARKRSEQILVRLTPDEAQGLRAAAAGAGVSVADFVAGAIDERPRPVVDLTHVAEIATATAVLAGAPKAIRDLEADLGRLSGRLSHFFTINYERASLHREDIHETLYALQDLMRRIEPEIAKMSAAVAEPRTEIATVMRAIAQELGAR